MKASKALYGAAAVWLLTSAISCAPAPPPAVRPAPPVATRPPEASPADTIPTPQPQPAQEAPQRQEWAAREPSLDVGLAWDLDSLTLTPVGGGALSGVATRRLDDGERLVVTRGRSRGAVARVRGRSRSWQTSLWRTDTLWLTPGEPLAVNGLTRWNGKTWRGEMKVFVNARGTLTLATRMPLEVYLLGVIPAEIGPLADDLIEAGRAQTIAARSFTMYYLGRRGIEGFDLFSTVEDQVYASIEGEKPLATRCVETTRGEMALHDGYPVRANYSSTCGGITTDVWEAWPDPPFPYLRSKRDRDRGSDFCSASRHYRWHEEWSTSEFVGNIRQYGPRFGVPQPSGGLGELLDVRVRSRSRSGRVWALEVVGSRGKVVVPSYSLRQVLRRPGHPEAILRSNLFKIDVKRSAGNGRVLAVVASGAGSGHGVGLCQTGALGMARLGSKDEEILRHYFSGIEIKRVY